MGCGSGLPTNQRRRQEDENMISNIDHALMGRVVVPLFRLLSGSLKIVMNQNLQETIPDDRKCPESEI